MLLTTLSELFGLCARYHLSAGSVYEDACTRSWDSGCEPHYYGIKKSSMVFGVVGVVFGQRALTNCLWQMFWVVNGLNREKRSHHVGCPFILS